MKTKDVILYGKICIIMIGVEGMKADNILRDQLNQSPAFSSEDFDEKADEIIKLIEGMK